MLVIGASGTTVTGEPSAAAASIVSRSRSTAWRGSTVPCGARPAEVRHAVVAVDVTGIDRALQQRVRGTGADRDGARAARLEHGEGVADDVGQGRVAADTGDGAQVQVGVQGRQDQGAGVVHSGVDVEDHGEGHGARVCRGSASVVG